VTATSDFFLLDDESVEYINATNPAVDPLNTVEESSYVSVDKTVGYELVDLDGDGFLDILYSNVFRLARYKQIPCILYSCLSVNEQGDLAAVRSRLVGMDHLYSNYDYMGILYKTLLTDRNGLNKDEILVVCPAEIELLDRHLETLERQNFIYSDDDGRYYVVQE
jgi:hypothetical protein